MIRKLVVSFPEKCIGCELCIIETQKQLNKMGLEGSLIRVLREKDQQKPGVKFLINLDPQINHLNIEKIKEICPTGVFTVEDIEEDGLLI